MRTSLGGLLTGLVLLAGCASPRSSGILPLDAGRHGLTVTSSDLGPAAELALGEATGFCTGQGLQTQLLRTRINPGDYHLEFRCIGGAQVLPGSLSDGPLVAARRQGTDAGGPPPVAVPVLLGPAFAVPGPAVALAPPGDGPTARRAEPASPGLPSQPPTLGALAAAARRPVPDAPPPRHGLFNRLFVADDRPGAAIGDPAGTNGLAAPGGAGASPWPTGLPLQPAPLPQPLARPRAFETLPSVTGLPGGPPHRALTPLPPVSKPSRPWAFLTDGLARLPTPAGSTTPAAEAAGQPDAGAIPPAGLWDTRRR